MSVFFAIFYYIFYKWIGEHRFFSYVIFCVVNNCLSGWIFLNVEWKVLNVDRYVVPMVRLSLVWQDLLLRHQSHHRLRSQPMVCHCMICMAWIEKFVSCIASLQFIEMALPSNRPHRFIANRYSALAGWIHQKSYTFGFFSYFLKFVAICITIFTFE